jgi:hypothetical protein
MFKKKRKKWTQKKNDGTYTFWDGLVEVLCWVPELLLFPLRLIWYLLRGIGKLISNVWDVF